MMACDKCGADPTAVPALIARVRVLTEALHEAAYELHTVRQRCGCYSQMAKHPTCIARLAVENKCYAALDAGKGAT